MSLGVGVVPGVAIGDPLGVGDVLGKGVDDPLGVGDVVGGGVGVAPVVDVGVIPVFMGTPLVLVGIAWRVGAGVGDPECDANNPGRSRRDSNTMTITNAPRSNAERRFLERGCG